MKYPLIIGIAGGTGSGKTTVVNKIINSLPAGEVAVMPQDSYYKDSSHIPPEERSKINFDEPNAIEWTLLVEHLKQLKEGKTIQMPTYSYLTCTRQAETVEVKPADVVIVEGILVLTDPSIRNMLDIKVFVDADPDDRLIRVIARDCIERGRTPRLSSTAIRMSSSPCIASTSSPPSATPTSSCPRAEATPWPSTS